MKNITLIWPFNMQAVKIPELFPIGLGFLMDNIDQSKYDLTFIDCAIEKWHPDSQELVERLESSNANLVGVSWWSNNTPMVERTLQTIKRVLPNAVVVVGGPHPSAYGESLIRSANIDYVFYGEAEVGFPQLIDLLAQYGVGKIPETELGNVDGLIFLDRFGMLRKNKQSMEPDIDVLGSLDYERLQLRRYQEQGYSYGGKVARESGLTAPMVATRGCPYKCNFCAAPAMNGKRLRRHSFEYITHHMSELYQKHDVRHIAIVDDNFTLDKKWAKAVCKHIAGLGYSDLTLSTPNGIRMERMDEELAQDMRAAGWREIVIAPESGSPRTLEEMDKHLNLAIVPTVIDMLHKADLRVNAFFILGYPAETMDDLLLTETFVDGLDLDNINLHIFQPLPGTPIFDRLVAAAEIPANFVPGSYQQVTYKPRHLEKEQVRDVYNRILNKFRDKKGWVTMNRNVAVVRENAELYGNELAGKDSPVLRPAVVSGGYSQVLVREN